VAARGADDAAAEAGAGSAGDEEAGPVTGGGSVRWAFAA
jgi:hypothetical protein